MEKWQIWDWDQVWFQSWASLNSCESITDIHSDWDITEAQYKLTVIILSLSPTWQGELMPLVIVI